MPTPMYLLLDLWFGGISGTPDQTTPTGPNNAYEVKYVKTWKFKGQTPAPAPAPAPTAANHLYVATSGSDANSCAQAAPCQTIARASQIANPDTIVHVAPGTYYGNFTTSASGTATGRISYLSDVKWGAKIVGTGTELTWTNSGSYNDINGFDISTSGRIAIYGTGSFGDISNCLVHDVMLSGGSTSNGGAGIDITGTSWKIHENIVRNIDAARVTGYSNVHGIYIANANAIVYNNIVSSVAAYGIQQWHGATRSIIVNNTIFNTYGGIMIGAGDSGALAGGSQYNYVANNISVNNIGFGIREYGTTSQNTYASNLLYNNPTNAAITGTVTGTINANPLFVNYQANGSGNYHLQSTSPAINIGTTSNAPAVDLDGVARPQGGVIDIGAYEYK